MKTIGFPISTKENEKRRCLIPKHISSIKNKKSIYIETGYGNVLGFTDEDYNRAGVHIITREEVLKKDIICDPKIGDAEYLSQLKDQIVFGWVHAVQNKNITEIMVKNKITAYAWEDMYDSGRHVFWRNNEIAGEAAIMHAYTLYGLFPYNTKVAILGRGNVARGALKILTLMGADVMVYTRKMEQLFRKEISKYDVIVNAILWDTSRKDHIIYKEDLKRMKKGALIIDISCDRNGGIETCIPTTIDNPTYVIDGITHYAVDHTPSLFYKTISESLSEIMIMYIDDLIEGNMNNDVLNNSLIIDHGKIIDQRIILFQNRK
ncbi:MAG TPA: N(5)-(carboxyethyl)ornithine synthase [Bacteroidales bacterium]|mgnify:FL=1|jgi:N5-(carboxyethyl)ornithine synthase|nr:N(5)-(carboxyethyl)ornithine synthase [Bacteroidales bacterium]